MSQEKPKGLTPSTDDSSSVKKSIGEQDALVNLYILDGAQPTPRANVRSELGKKLGDARLGRLLSSGRVTILNEQEEAKRIVGESESVPKTSLAGQAG